MSVFDSPARSQFLRLSNPGEAPTVGQPGAFAVNLIDRVLWTFDEVGQPLLLGRSLDTHSSARAYTADAVVIRDNALWAANVDLTPRAFDPADWTPLSADEIRPPSEPSASGVVSGGTLNPASGNSVNVGAGSGVIVTGTVRQDVTWVAQTVSLPSGGSTVRAVVVQSNGGIASVAATDVLSARRTRIILGYAVYDGAGNIATIRNVPRVIQQAAQDLGDLVDALGGAFIVSGARLSAGAGLTLNVSQGNIFGQALRWRSTPETPNIATHPPATGFTLRIVNSTGAELDVTPTVPFDVYEAGALPFGFATSHFVFAATDGSPRWLQIGQVAHASFEEALRRLDEDWAGLISPFKTSPFAVLLGAVVVSNTAMVDLDGRVVPTAPGPSVATRFTIPTGELGFMRVDGTTAMQGPLDMNGNPVQNAIIDEGVF